MNTEGFACLNQRCAYCGINDADTHALVGDGTLGRAERILEFTCLYGNPNYSGGPITCAEQPG